MGRQRGLIYGAKLALIAGAYYGSAKLGLGLAFGTSSATAVWPPTGVALAALVLWGYRVWPGIAVGALLANAWTGVPVIAVLGITCGNTLEGLAGAYLLRRVDFRPWLDRTRDVIALVALAAPASTIVSATIGVASLVVGDEVALGDAASVWRVWWLGDLGGDLLVAPAILVAVAHWPYTRAPGRALEAAALAAVLLGVTGAVLSQETTLIYLVFPVLIWATLRFWQPGAAFSSLTVATVAVAFTANDAGPFVRGNPDDSLLLAQTFVGVSGILTLVLAAALSERRRAEETTHDIERARLDDLRASRARIVEAGDRERRRVERNLHDGTQQRLMSVAMVLRLAEGRAREIDASLDGLLGEAAEELDGAIRDVRELARGLHPAILADVGLQGALEALAERSAVPVQISLDVPGPVPGSTEVGAYYVVAEALANVTKHARASGASVRLARRDGLLRVEVSDDGEGGATAGPGSGLQGLADRVDALGGHLHLESPPGGGTLLAVELPCA